MKEPLFGDKYYVPESATIPLTTPDPRHRRRIDPGTFDRWRWSSRRLRRQNSRPGTELWRGPYPQYTLYRERRESTTGRKLFLAGVPTVQCRLAYLPGKRHRRRGHTHLHDSQQ